MYGSSKMKKPAIFFILSLGFCSNSNQKQALKRCAAVQLPTAWHITSILLKLLRHDYGWYVCLKEKKPIQSIIRVAQPVSYRCQLSSPHINPLSPSLPVALLNWAELLLPPAEWPVTVPPLATLQNIERCILAWLPLWIMLLVRDVKQQSDVIETS